MTQTQINKYEQTFLKPLFNIEYYTRQKFTIYINRCYRNSS